MSDGGQQATDSTGVRRRRRAVGPEGARPHQPIDAAFSGEDHGAGADKEEPDADERLRREVPPHHGG